MFHRYAPWLALAVVAGAVVVTRPTAADDAPEKKKDEAKAAKPATVRAEKGPLTAFTALKGTVQADDPAEVSVKLKAWGGPLIVKKAVEHGAAVRAGDVLVEFDPEKLDLLLRDTRREHDLTELAIRQAELELPILERQLPLDLAAAERDFKHATDDLKFFQDVDRKLAVLSAETDVKMVNYYVESARDELKQLEKMYRDKDLTEETEQMILKRYKFFLEYYSVYAQIVRTQTERELTVGLPRREERVKDAVAKSELALARARDVQPLAVRQKQLALAKQRYESAKAKEKLADLETDRAALTVKAPADGLAYHGRYVRGQWIVPAGGQGPVLLGGGPVNSGDVFVTVVNPAKLVVRAEAEEKELPGLKPGLAGRMAPAAFPDRRVQVKLDRVSSAPLNGKFEVVAVPEAGQGEKLVPGMTGPIRFVTAKKDDAVTVPKTAVFDDDAEDIKYVYLPAKSGKGEKPEKRTVKVGATSGDRVEILDGLAAGDEILAAKP